VIAIDVYSSSGDTSYTPKAGFALLIVTIKQQNHGSQPTTANGAVDWSLQDSSGAKFPLIPQSAYGSFPQENVGAGETATGTLVYEVPSDKEHVLLIFSPAGGGNQATWEISRG
jgi:hypothetical protein